MEREELIASHRIKCQAVDEAGAQYLRKEDSEAVIVNVYKDGRTEVLCRYVEWGCVIPRCNPVLRRGVITSFSEDELGDCMYALPKRSALS